MKKLFIYSFVFSIAILSLFTSTKVEAKCGLKQTTTGTGGCVSKTTSTSDNRLSVPVDFSTSLMNFTNTINGEDYIPWRTSEPIVIGQSSSIVQSLIDTLRLFGFFPSDPSLVGARMFGQTTADSIYMLRTVLGVQPGDSLDRPTQSQFSSFIDSFIQADRTLPNHNIVPTGFSIKYPNGFVSFFNPETNMFSVPSSATAGSVPPTGTAVRCTGGSIKCGGVDIGGLGSTYSYFGCWGGEWHVMGIAC